MRTAKELTQMFFHDLKEYNSTNFKNILEADLSKNDPCAFKAFSSAVTRYFIFKERHPEVTEQEANILYFKLKLDLVARYFTEFPDACPDSLIAFQLELQNYISETRGTVYEQKASI